MKLLKKIENIMLNFLLKLPILKRLIPSILSIILKVIKKNKGYFKINNFYMYLDFFDPIDKEIILKKNYEIEEINYFCNIIKKNKIRKFIDIGANCGYYSFYISNKFKKIKTFSFEPNIRAYQKLEKTFIKNKNLKNRLSINNYGLSNKNKKLKMMSMFKSGRLHTNSTIVKGRKRDKNWVYTQAQFKIGDQVIKLKKEILAIKIDVEGHETEVLKGLKKIINKNKCFIMVEIGDINFKKTNLYLLSNSYRLIYSCKSRLNYFYKN